MAKRYTLGDVIRAGFIPRPGTNAVMNESNLSEISRKMRAASHDAAAVLQPNNGIPDHLLNLFNPEIIRIVLAATIAEELAGAAVKRGSFATKSTNFIMGEYSGWVDTYGDFSHDGSVDSNYKFPGRDVWQFETTLKVGDLEQAEWSEANINILADKELAAAETIRRGFEAAWLYGVNGGPQFRNYGLLNDPSYLPAIAPRPDANNKVEWPDKGAVDLFTDVVALKARLNEQSNGKIKDNAEMRLGLSTTRSTELLKTNEFGLTVEGLIKRAFPKLEIVTGPQFTTNAGEMMQLRAVAIDGRRTVDIAFNERYRSHGMRMKLSSREEKKSAGSWGAVNYFPFAVATMFGI